MPLSRDLITQRADAGHLDAADVPRLQVQRRGAPVADTGGRAGEDQVAGAKSGELRDRRDEPRDGENQQLDGRVLYFLAVEHGGDPLRGDVPVSYTHLRAHETR